MKIEFNPASRFDGHLIVDECEHGFQRMYIKPGTEFMMANTAVLYGVYANRCEYPGCDIPFTKFSFAK